MRCQAVHCGLSCCHDARDTSGYNITRILIDWRCRWRLSVCLFVIVCWCLGGWPSAPMKRMHAHNGCLSVGPSSIAIKGCAALQGLGGSMGCTQGCLICCLLRTATGKPFSRRPFTRGGVVSCNTQQPTKCLLLCFQLSTATARHVNFDWGGSTWHLRLAWWLMQGK